ncbi:MAG TPA: POTRA domain-containing protein, partial [Polyangiaceae bacterium]
MCSWRGVRTLVVCVALLLLSAPSLAQRSAEPANAPDESAASNERVTPREIPSLGPPLPALPPGSRVGRIEVVVEGELWQEQVALTRVRVGDPFTAEVARRALRELGDMGRFASAVAEVVHAGSLLVLRLRVVPRRTVASVRLEGSALGREELLTQAEVMVGMELTEQDLPKIAARVAAAHAENGYTSAKARALVVDTDDPRAVLLSIVVDAGSPLTVKSRSFSVVPAANRARIERFFSEYEVDLGDLASPQALLAADDALAEELRLAGFHHANVSHRLAHRGYDASLIVDIDAGPLVVLKFSRNDTFDEALLEGELLDERTDDWSPFALNAKLSEFYQQRGFLDVESSVEVRKSDDGSLMELWFHVREGAPVRVERRHYPCLTGPLDAAEIDSEIDGFLAEELPGDDFFEAVNPNAVDPSFGGIERGAVVPYRVEPWQHFVPEVYERALEHVQDLYRSKGYLSAEVGPAIPVRTRCDPRAQPGTCRPLAPVRLPQFGCSYDEIGLPLAETVEQGSQCASDTRKSVTCSERADLVIPIKLGPLTRLYDVAFAGNRALIEQELFEVAELEPGTPVSLVEVEAARQRLLERYAEEAYAFAEISTPLELSYDHTRGRVLFEIVEREQVRVSRIEIRGARRTQEGLIRRRIALEAGGLYRRSLVRRTEEQLATLGVFASVTVGFADPYVPAREKVVVIQVSEKNFQYVDTRSGFSTGDGVRFTFEYGHRSIAGSAIQFTLRSQLGILPIALIFEKDVRDKFEELSLVERLERRNSVSVEFPEIGLGPRFRLTVEGLDVRDNSRDFGITKDAALLTLHYRPGRELSLQLGGSLELNDARIFGQEQKGALEDYVQNNPQLRNVFRVPEGTTVALAQRVELAWDRRDQPLEPSSGTFVAAGVEHVNANPVEEEQTAGTPEDSGVFAATPSDFLRYTNRVAGYVRLREDGLSLAASFRWGLIQQLTAESRTYPDRLFFMGGFDTVRGFLQDAMIPEDIAQRLLESARDPACSSAMPPDSCLTTNEVVIRGGDFFVNPRVELRVPLGQTLRTAFFVDSGNLWTSTESSAFEELRLRYAVGAGLRVGTPVGPLVFDYGINVERFLDAILPERETQ